MTPTSRTTLFKALLLAGSAMLGLALVEAGLRLIHPCPYLGYEYEPPQRAFFAYDPQLGWTGRTDAKGTFASRDFKVVVTHDERGFRNVHPPHVQGRTNVLVLGDSFGWGWGVEDDETFASQAPALSERVNVYSLAAPGYGTGQQLLGLERFLSREDRPHDERPDGVVLLMYYNDLIDAVSEERYGYSKPRYVLEEGALRLTNVPVPEPERSAHDETPREPRRSGGGILRRLHSYNLLWNRLYATMWQPGGAAGEVSAEVDLELNARLLEEIERISGEDGMFFHVVFLLTGATTEHWEERLRELGRRLERLGVAHSYFESRAVPSTDLCLDRHLNPFGHQLLARHVIDVANEAR